MKDKLKEVLKNKKLLYILGGVLLLLVAVVVFFCFFLKKEKTYAITFDTDGGTAIEQIIVKDGETVNFPEDPTKEGFKFNGWLLDGQPFSPSAEITKDITLVASWMAEDAVTFKVTFMPDNGKKPMEIEVEENESVAKPLDPTKANATFKGWFLDGAEYDFTQPVTRDIILVAQWEEVKKEEVKKDEKKDVKKEEKKEEDKEEAPAPKVEQPKTPEAPAEKLIITTANPLRIWKGKTGTIGVSGVSSATFVSNNPAVATVNASGVVTGIKEGGTAIITVTGSNGEKADITVYVEYQWITINTDRTIVAPGIAANITATRTECGMGMCGAPKDLTSQMTFTTNNSNWLTVSGSGNVRTTNIPLPGTIYNTENVTITAKFAGLTDSIVMKVEGNYLLNGTSSAWDEQPQIYIGNTKEFNVNIPSTFSKNSDPRFDINTTSGTRVVVTPISPTPANNPARLTFTTPAGQQKTVIFIIR